MPATLTIKTKGRILCKEGQKVTSGEILAEEDFIPQLISLNIAKFLSISPKKCLKFLIKKLGEEVKTSEIIVRKRTLFGLGKKILKSPCDGVLEKLDTETGDLIISLPKEKRIVKSPVSGVIKKIDEDKGEILISFPGQEIKLKEAIGNFSQGEIRVIEEASLFSLNKGLQGKIICAKLWQEDSLEKAFALGVAAVLAIKLPFFDWEKQKKGRRLSIGEREETFIFNLGIVEENEFKILEKNKGKLAIFEPREKKVIIIN